MDYDVIRAAMHQLEMQAATISDAYGTLAALLPANPVPVPAAPPPGQTRRAVAPARVTAPPDKAPRTPVNARQVPARPPIRDAPEPSRARPVPPTATVQARTTKDDKLVAEIGRVKGMAATAAAAFLQVTLSGVWTRLQRLVEEGRLTIGGDKVYRRAVAQDDERAS
jgi:hypothetical protein